jgi:hypothetical protein
MLRHEVVQIALNKLDVVHSAQAKASKDKPSSQRHGRFGPGSDPAPNPWQEGITKPRLGREQELPFPFMFNQR